MKEKETESLKSFKDLCGSPPQKNFYVEASPMELSSVDPLRLDFVKTSVLYIASVCWQSQSVHWSSAKNYSPDDDFYLFFPL